MVKRVGPGEGIGAETGKKSQKGRQWTWSKHGGPEIAWESAKRAARWPSVEPSP